MIKLIILNEFDKTQKTKNEYANKNKLIRLIKLN